MEEKYLLLYKDTGLTSFSFCSREERERWGPSVYPKLHCLYVSNIKLTSKKYQTLQMLGGQKPPTVLSINGAKDIFSYC